MTLANVLTLALMGWFLWWFLSREWREYRAFQVADEQAAHYVGLDDLMGPTQSPPPPAPLDPSAEPAFQFPGIPSGWTLDRYARDGLTQINVHLAQAARHQP